MRAEDQAAIGSRVRERLTATLGERKQAELARAVELTPDALSRSLRGERAFSSLELARVAEKLRTDLHYLITGAPDPHRIVVAARHTYDQEQLRHLAEEPEDDDGLAQVTLAYRQARSWLTPGVSELPSEAAELRARLGEGFVMAFADRVEERLGVDVVRIQGLATDYSFTAAGRPCVLLASEPNWFHSNWSLAHELGHLALRHHEAEDPKAHEAAANSFAAELLLPERLMRAVNWQEVDQRHLARFVWEHGVSTRAVGVRLKALDLVANTSVAQWLDEVTLRLLRQGLVAEDLPGTGAADPISSRMSRAAERRFPPELIKAHLAGIAEGVLGKETLAWMLEVSVESLYVDEPDPVEETPADQLMADLGLLG